MVPSGWKKDIIGNHIALLSGFPFKSKEYTDAPDAIRLLRGDNVAQGYIRWTGCKRWENNNGLDVNRFALEPFDLVIAMDRTWVSSGLKISEIKEEDTPSLLVQRVSRLRANDSFVQGLLKQIFNSYRFEQYVKGVQTETAVPHISAQQIKEYPILLPPLSEQKKIARILSTWDKVIETVDKLIENSQQQKKALMQQLLTGKKRLPGFSGEWKTIKLNKLCNVRRGASPRPISDAKWFADEGRGWIRIADATASESRYLTETTQKLSPLGVEKSVSVDPGDLIMSICGTIGVPRILSIAACIHDGFVVFRDYADKLHLEFLYHYLNLFTLRLANSGQPGTQKNLNTTIVGNLEVPLIAIEEQIAIANVLNKAEEHALSLQREHDIFRIQKQALMQQLLTGKRRVQVTE